MSSEVVLCHQRLSCVIRGCPLSCEVVLCHQRLSFVIRGCPLSSKVVLWGVFMGVLWCVLWGKVGQLMIVPIGPKRRFPSHLYCWTNRPEVCLPFKALFSTQVHLATNLGYSGLILNYMFAASGPLQAERRPNRVLSFCRRTVRGH